MKANTEKMDHLVHELNNSLTILMMKAEQLESELSELKNAEKSIQLAQAIEALAHKMSKMINGGD